MRLVLNTLLFLVLSFFFFNIAGLEASTLFARSADVQSGSLSAVLADK